MSLSAFVHTHPYLRFLKSLNNSFWWGLLQTGKVMFNENPDKQSW